MDTFLTALAILAIIGLSLYGIDQKGKHVATAVRRKGDEEYFEQSAHYKKAWYSLVAADILFLVWIISSHVILGASLVVGILCFISTTVSTYSMGLQLKSPTAKLKEQYIAKVISTAFSLAAFIWMIARIFIS